MKDRIVCCVLFAFVVWAMSNEKTTPKEQNPCFIVFLFVLLSLQVLATERPILREKTKRGKQDSKKEEKKRKNKQ